MRFAPSPRLVLAASALALAASCMSSTKESAPTGPLNTYDSLPFASEVGQGMAYMQEQGEELVAAVEALVAALAQGDLTTCQTAYCAARAPYEEIELLAAAFPELDRAIDARPYEFPTGEFDTQFRGFHRIEIILFARKKPAVAIPYADQLLVDVRELQTVLADRARYSAEMAFDAMIERCMEIATRTISSEEEVWSDQSLIVVRHAWIGIHSQYRFYGSKLRVRDAQLAERLDRTYRRATELIAQDFPIGQVQGAPYSMLNRTRRREIADASLKLRRYLIQAQETLDLVDA